MPFGRKKEEKPVGTVYTLQEALRRGLVSFELYGVRSGDPSHLKIRLTRLTDEPMTVVIPKGTEFVPVRREKTNTAGAGS